MGLSLWQRMGHGIGYRLVQLGFRFAGIAGRYPIQKPLDPADLEILENGQFQASVAETSCLTLLDTPRLANLWTLCSLTDPAGAIMEIGTYKGGGALHLSNSNPRRKVIVCDSFTGFEALDARLDGRFREDMFQDTSRGAVEHLFRSRGRDYQIVEGFFPGSCAGTKLPPISFVHLDVDVHKATVEALGFLIGANCLLPQSLIVLDDYNRHATGVNEGVAEFLAHHSEWVALPLFPGQCVMLDRTSFAGRAAALQPARPAPSAW